MVESDFRGKALQFHQTVQKRAVTSVLLYCAAIPLAFVSVYISFVIFISVQMMFFYLAHLAYEKIIGWRVNVRKIKAV